MKTLGKVLILFAISGQAFAASTEVTIVNASSFAVHLKQAQGFDENQNRLAGGFQGSNETIPAGGSLKVPSIQVPDKDKEWQFEYYLVSDTFTNANCILQKQTVDTTLKSIAISVHDNGEVSGIPEVACTVESISGDSLCTSPGALATVSLQISSLPKNTIVASYVTGLTYDLSTNQTIDSPILESKISITPGSSVIYETIGISACDPTELELYFSPSDDLCTIKLDPSDADRLVSVDLKQYSITEAGKKVPLLKCVNWRRKVGTSL